MATHSSTLAQKIPWTEGPGRLQSMGSQRVGHNWATSLTLATFITSHLSILYQSTKSWNLQVVIGSMTNLDSMLKSRDITLPTKVHLVKAMVYPVVMCECESWAIEKLNPEELMLLSCGVGEDSWESLGLQEDPTSPFWRRSALGFLWQEWCWSWNSSTLATSCEELTH